MKKLPAVIGNRFFSPAQADAVHRLAARLGVGEMEAAARAAEVGLYALGFLEGGADPDVVIEKLYGKIDWSAPRYGASNPAAFSTALTDVHCEAESFLADLEAKERETWDRKRKAS